MKNRGNNLHTHTSTHTHKQINTHTQLYCLWPFFCNPPPHCVHPFTRLPRGALAPRLGCKYLCKKIKKSSPRCWKNWHQKRQQKKCRKENVMLKSEHFLSLWALGPGSEHPWMPESFIIWQYGSAVQFYLLAGGKWSTTHSARSKRESEGSKDKDRDRVSEKPSFMQKQPPESFMATHGRFSL